MQQSQNIVPLAQHDSSCHTCFSSCAHCEVPQDYVVCCHAANVGVPISEMSDAYTKESAILSEAIFKYGALDPYDPQRVQVVNVSTFCFPIYCPVAARQCPPVWA